MLEHNKKMQAFLKGNGINAIPWRIDKGSMKGCWRIYSKKGKGFEHMEPWTTDTAAKMTALGFKDFDWQPLGQFSGNGGMFQVFARTHLIL